MDLVELLSLRGADLPSVVASVNAAIGLRVGDLLLAAGSLVEGLGNRRSDVDLLLITPRDPHSLPARDELALIAGRCLIDLRVLQLTELDELVGRLRAWSEAPWEITHPVTFSLDERLLLHRLLHGRVLHDAGAEAIATRMPRRGELARLKLQVARQLGRTIQVDMAGYRESGDPRSLVFAAQELLGHAVDALAAGHELTNPAAKWRHRLLDLIPTSWERALVLRPTKRTAGQQFWYLHRAPEEPREEAAREHAFQIATFARAVFAWAEGHLVGTAPPASLPAARPTLKPRAAWPALELRADDTVLPCLDLDVDFVLGRDHVTLARLNEFDAAVEISPREFSLALLCDGVTTAREAETFIHEIGGVVTRRLLSRLEHANLTVHAMNR